MTAPPDTLVITLIPGDGADQCLCLGDGHTTPGCPQHPDGGEDR